LVLFFVQLLVPFRIHPDYCSIDTFLMLTSESKQFSYINPSIMSKVLEVLGGLATAVVVSVASGAEKACDVISDAACTGAKIVTNAAEGVKEIAKGKSENSSKGKS
jgi:hypothetical protein